MTLTENLYQLKSPILIPGTGTDIAAEDDKKSVRAAAQGGGNYSGRNAMDELGQEIELRVRLHLSAIHSTPSQNKTRVL